LKRSANKEEEKKKKNASKLQMAMVVIGPARERKEDGDCF
jgi:hypothetical protein